jgi:ABC-type multidrug transport system permease subunit
MVQYLFAYNMVRFNGLWIYMVLCAWGLSLSAGSTAVFLGSAIGDLKTATELMPLLFVPQMLFAGFFVKISQIPVFLRWAQYLCSLKYAMNLILLIEFNPNNRNCEGFAAANCQSVLDNNDIKQDDWWIYALLLIVVFAGFRILAAVTLTQRAKRFY